MSKKRDLLGNEMLPLDLEEQIPIAEKDLVDGRDELNLAEFPICSLAGKGAREDTKVFKDQLWDRDTKSYITRTLTVEAPKKVGIPNSTDEDIILALIQISRRQGFPRKVRFSRYELLRVLNWKDSGTNYKRLEDAILRWNKTTLSYENAWRRILEDGRKVWTHASFHIIEDFEFNKKDSAYSPDFCTIIWGERTQESFVNGFLKKLNFKQYLDFKSDITKRMYRFLDKRFWLKKHWKFDLKEFAYEKIGIGRNYNVAQIKQKLERAIQELVKIGFITDMPKHERYEKARVGEWFVVFQAVKQPESQKTLKLEEEELSVLEKMLVHRGIRSAVAKKLVAEFPDEVVSEQIEVFDYLVGKHASKPPTAGFLVTSIREHFKHEFPEGFKTNQEKLREAAERKEKQLAKDLAEKQKRDEISRLEAEKEAQLKRIQKFFDSLSAQDQKKVKSQAQREADESGMLDGKENSTLAQLYIKASITEILLKQMGETEIEVPSL